MTTRIQCSVETIRAMLTIAAKKDCRQYLNGIYLDFPQQRLVATDGHMLIAVNVTVDGDYAEPVIVPREALEAVVKGGNRSDDMVLFFNPVSRMINIERNSGLCNITAPVDGRFPEYERVIPRKVTGDVVQFNPHYLATLASALQQITGSKFAPVVGHNGFAGALVACADTGGHAIGVLMPLRITGDAEAEADRFFSTSFSANKSRADSDVVLYQATA